MSRSDTIFDRGLAVGFYDITDDTWRFRFRGESFELRNLSLDDVRPNRCVTIFSIPEIRFGMVAKIEEVRAAAAR